MLEARSIAAAHQQGSKAQQGVIFDTVNLVRKMCSFAEPKEGYSQVNKDDNEVEASGPENTTWDPFLLGKSCVQIQHPREEKSQWSYCLNQGIYQWRKVSITEHSLGRGPSTRSIPICQPVWRPSGLTQTEVLKALGSTTRKGRPLGFFLGKKHQVRTTMDLSDIMQRMVYKEPLVNHWACIQVVWKTWTRRVSDKNITGTRGRVKSFWEVPVQIEPQSEVIL